MGSAIEDLLLLDIITFLDIPTSLPFRRSCHHIGESMTMYETSIVRGFLTQDGYSEISESSIASPSSFRDLPQFEQAADLLLHPWPNT